MVFIKIAFKMKSKVIKNIRISQWLWDLWRIIAESWIPIILPKLVDVPQEPPINPLDDFENQPPTIETKQGKQIDYEAPIITKHNWKNIGL